jgi:hypothetical protein
MSQQPNSMSITWCAARVADARRRAKPLTHTLPSQGASHDRRLLLAAYDAHELEIMQLRGQLRDAEQVIKDLSRP